MAAKSTVTYICTECGYESRKWLGKCPSCQAWNTLEEQEVVALPAAKKAAAPVARASDPNHQALPVARVSREDFPRAVTGIQELDRVLGGGIVPGSVVLIGGDPGIGKSTLLLQAADALAKACGRVLYVSGEESARQVAMRAERLRVDAGELLILAQTQLEDVLEQIVRHEPSFVIIDSIQTMAREDVSSAPGSVTQIRECAAALISTAKSRGCSIFLVGHVTKAGAIAGPRILEHMVDTVLYFEGEQDGAFRVLRAAKNRFGSTQEIGVFEMHEDGMNEVRDPSALFLTQDRGQEPGSVVTCSMEGTRPMLVELQSLVTQSQPGNARRQVTGMDYGRVMMLLAVLEKHTRLRLFDQDVYVNVAGGLRLVEPAADLAAMMAVASSASGRILPGKTAIFGEVGLTGEVRPVRFADMRLAELARSGWNRVILPRRNLNGLQVPSGLQVVGVSQVAEALAQLKQEE